ncbi:hypothetical protein PROFUN_05964 [Planoprotostelium fungivorum]|uniref:RING-type domain-containing protein n=1 Tax=Planoprotostelium fungivorum TaxID=1890364 RepID=A0A2P6NP90_9EUKA|nr:hypothetical protein PROFUN_05964 [Planoprotostelium fungivorum]
MSSISSRRRKLRSSADKEDEGEIDPILTSSNERLTRGKSLERKRSLGASGGVEKSKMEGENRMDNVEKKTPPKPVKTQHRSKTAPIRFGVLSDEEESPAPTRSKRMTRSKSQPGFRKCYREDQSDEDSPSSEDYIEETKKRRTNERKRSSSRRNKQTSIDEPEEEESPMKKLKSSPDDKPSPDPLHSKEEAIEEITDDVSGVDEPFSPQKLRSIQRTLEEDKEVVEEITDEIEDEDSRPTQLPLPRLDEMRGEEKKEGMEKNQFTPPRERPIRRLFASPARQNSTPEEENNEFLVSTQQATQMSPIAPQNSPAPTQSTPPAYNAVTSTHDVPVRRKLFADASSQSSQTLVSTPTFDLEEVCNSHPSVSYAATTSQEPIPPTQLVYNSSNEKSDLLFSQESSPLPTQLVNVDHHERAPVTVDISYGSPIAPTQPIEPNSPHPPTQIVSEEVRNNVDHVIRYKITVDVSDSPIAETQRMDVFDSPVMNTQRINNVDTPLVTGRLIEPHEGSPFATTQRINNVDSPIAVTQRVMESPLAATQRVNNVDSPIAVTQRVMESPLAATQRVNNVDSPIAVTQRVMESPLAATQRVKNVDSPIAPTQPIRVDLYSPIAPTQKTRNNVDSPIALTQRVDTSYSSPIAPTQLLNVDTTRRPDATTNKTEEEEELVSTQTILHTTREEDIPPTQMIDAEIHSRATPEVVFDLPTQHSQPVSAMDLSIDGDLLVSTQKTRSQSSQSPLKRPSQTFSTPKKTQLQSTPKTPGWLQFSEEESSLTCTPDERREEKKKRLRQVDLTSSPTQNSQDELDFLLMPTPGVRLKKKEEKEQTEEKEKKEDNGKEEEKEEEKGGKEEEEELDDCAICQEKITERGIIDSCNHAYCFICIRMWSQKATQCPLCKATFHTITSVDIKNIPGVKPRMKKKLRVTPKQLQVDYNDEFYWSSDDDDDGSNLSIEDDGFIDDSEVRSDDDNSEEEYEEGEQSDTEFGIPSARRSDSRVRTRLRTRSLSTGNTMMRGQDHWRRMANGDAIDLTRSQPRLAQRTSDNQSGSIRTAPRQSQIIDRLPAASSPTRHSTSNNRSGIRVRPPPLVNPFDQASKDMSNNRKVVDITTPKRPNPIPRQSPSDPSIKSSHRPVLPQRPIASQRPPSTLQRSTTATELRNNPSPGGGTNNSNRKSRDTSLTTSSPLVSTAPIKKSKEDGTQSLTRGSTNSNQKGGNRGDDTIAPATRGGKAATKSKGIKEGPPGDLVMLQMAREYHKSMKKKEESPPARPHADHRQNFRWAKDPTQSSSGRGGRSSRGGLTRFFATNVNKM